MTMKKLFLLFIILLLPVASFGQKKGYSGYWGTQIGMPSGGSTEYFPIEVTLSPAYNFNSNFYVKADFQANFGLFKAASDKSYETTGALGVGAGLMFLKFDMGYVESYVTGGGSIGSGDWKYNYGEWGARVNLGKCATRASLGLGVKYYDSRRSEFKNYWNFFVSFGFKFN